MQKLTRTEEGHYDVVVDGRVIGEVFKTTMNVVTAWKARVNGSPRCLGVTSQRVDGSTRFYSNEYDRRSQAVSALVAAVAKAAA